MGRRPGTALLAVFFGLAAVPVAAQVVDTTPEASPVPEGGPAAPGPAAAPTNPPQAPSLRLAEPGADIAPVQQSDPLAPAFLIMPKVAVSETLTDNARRTPSRRVADFDTLLSPGLSVSIDTPRLQAVGNGNFNLEKFAFADDQNRQFLSLYGSGLLTVVPSALFVDAKSTITQASLTGAAGFGQVGQQAKGEQTQVLSASLSPYYRTSYRGLLDGELRYRLSAIDSSGLGVATTSQNNASLSNATINQGTLTLATGRDFQRLLARLTLDATDLDTTSTARNSRLTAYNDFEYRFRPNLAAIGRLGFEDINYPLVRSASVFGPAWQIGGRADFSPDAEYAIFRYGKQEGIYGFSGAVRYQVTPATTLTATASQGIGSQQEQIAAALAQSKLDTTGAVVDQYDLPTAFVNPDFALNNQVFRSKQYRVNLTSEIGPNRFTVYGLYTRRSSITSTTPPSTSIGVHFDWNREIRPSLTGRASFGYTNVSNLAVAPVNNPNAVTVINNTDTLVGDASINYLFTETLTGSIAYNVSYQIGGPSISSANTINVGNILTNRLTFLLTKTF
jgi:uncharacterized protein (PEP-CTERM system associated)